MKVRMTQEERLKAYNRGKILYEPKHHIFIFKFMGGHYTTNKNRNKVYSLDYHTWQIAERQGSLRKFGMIWFKIVRKMEV